MHRPLARNFAVASENKIHSDLIAQRLGFTGALVPGVTVFGHLTWPLTQQFGDRWLRQSSVSTRFLKPAYDGERLAVTHRRDGERIDVECRNESQVLLATLECRLAEPPPVNALAQLRGSPSSGERVKVEWDAIHLNQPFASYAWSPDAAYNAEYASRLDDDTELFKTGVLHPHAVLSQANQALVKHFVMPAWIHTGSEIIFRDLLRVGDAIEVRAVPVEKWEKKGHQFIKLYIAYVRGDTVVTEIDHTAIFRIAGG